MTIIRCPKCGYTISDRAPACPKCKLPLRDALKSSGAPSPAQSVSPPVTPPASQSVPPAERSSPSTSTPGDEKKGSESKLGGFLSRIDNREIALKVVREASNAFFVVAAIQGLLGMFFAPAVLPDAVAYAILAASLRKWHSRVAAVLLLLVAGLGAGATVLNRMGITHAGGKNIFLAALMLLVAVRAVEATFKLRGRFGEDLEVAS